jgi:hypothetical protein
MIIYDVVINTFLKIKQILIRLYEKNQITSSQVHQAIRCYNEQMINVEKIKIYEKLLKFNFNIRILFVVNAMRFDMNISNVDICIQWKKIFNVRALMSRANRTTKDVDRFEKFIWFSLAWCKEKRTITSTRDMRRCSLRQVSNIKDEIDSKTEEDELRRKILKKKKPNCRKIAIKTRAFLKDVLWWIINESSCIRKTISKTLNESNMNDFFRR